MKRRDFLSGAALSSLGMSFAVEELHAEPQAKAAEKPVGPPVSCAVIGLGVQGREILSVLAKSAGVLVPAICETYAAPGYLKRSTDIVPKAQVVSDYKAVLSRADVQAVFIATPSHLHKQIVLDAIAAGKHVYCEAPLASSIEEARAIATAGAAAKTVFQAGLQFRSNKMHNHVVNFVRAGALGTVTSGRAQWHKKATWKRAGATPQRAKELNWRLVKETSGGLPNEVCIHQLDIASWYIKALPTAVTAWGSVNHYTADGMQVADNVQCMLEYPGNIRYYLEASLSSSFDGFYETLSGSDAAMMLRDQRGWMFKEADAPLLGWEVYARKDTLSIGQTDYGTGIALVADATKLLAQGLQPEKVGTDVTKTALYFACDNFMKSIRTKSKAVAGALEGFRANVVALKVQEAVTTGNKVVFQKEWFTL